MGDAERRSIRRLVESDAADFARLRRAALLDAPLAFASSPDDDFALDPESILEQLRKASESVLFGAFLGDRLAGCVGIHRDRHSKAAHKAHVWGMYVVPDARRRGLAAELLDAALCHARTLPGIGWVELGVSEAAPEARRLYEAAGFRRWGLEPDSLRHEGRSTDQHHMALRLADS